MSLEAQQELIKKIPRYSSGKIKGERGFEIEKLLSNYRYSPRDLEIVAKEVGKLSEQYGHEGTYQIGFKKGRYK